MVKTHLDSKNLKYAGQTVRQTLNKLTKEQKIFDAGRGWYSTIREAFMLDSQPVESIVKELKNEFPLLDYSCWSTEQIKSFFHHLQTGFVTFIYSDFDSLPTIYSKLRQSYPDIYLNPVQEEVYKNFEIKENTLVLRPCISESPVKNGYATIEKILIDLFLEKDRLVIIDGAEYDRIFINVIGNTRINIARLLRYGKRREIRTQILGRIY